MAPRASETTSGAGLTALLAAAILLTAGMPLGAQGAVSAARDPGAQVLLQAEAAFGRGEVSAALDLLRSLRSSYPSSPSVPPSLTLSVQYSLASGDEYRARYFYQLLLEDFPGSGAAFAAAVAVGRHYYDTRAWDASLEYYRGAVDAFRTGASGPRAELDAALLRAAELSLYHAEDPAGARAFLGKILAANLSPADRRLYNEMRIRLLWSVIDPGALGLKDANVSSLRVDGDDLWVGTWNGGVSRYTVSSGHADPFPGPAFSRSIEIADRRVWVGTAEGLAWYGKGTGTWGFEDSFQGRNPRKVQVVRRAAGILYAGTLGDGLFRQGDAGWEPVSDGGLPGLFITALAEDAARGRLLIGTMNLGVVIRDLKTGVMSVLSDLAPGFTSDNITSILPAADGRIWIGTYGEGLSAWAPDTGMVRRYTRASGEIGDDWVLASRETDRGLYFGTFGGGVSFLSRSGTWRKIGIADGLAALDVTAIEWRAPWLFFGTLGAGVSVYDEAGDAVQP